MSEYRAKVSWRRSPQDVFRDNKYSRGHQWEFDGGVIVPASSSPSVVPLPYSIEANVDPEEAFVASLSSCHMLFFLSIAAKQGYVADHYADNATGTMATDAIGKISMTQVILRPQVTFVGALLPDKDDVVHMHHLAHEQCFIANSVKTQVLVEPMFLPII